MTPRATAELYRRITTRTLLGASSDDVIWRILSQQRQLDRIPRLAGEATGSVWGGKSGTLHGSRADSGVLTTNAGRFVLVMLVDRIPDLAGAATKVTETMGEVAKAIVDEWSRSGDVSPRPTIAPAEASEVVAAQHLTSSAGSP